METATAETKRSIRRGSSAPKEVKKQVERVKTTIVLDADLDFRLGASAEFRKMNRSELAAMLIDQGLKVTNFDKHLRQFTESADGLSELKSAG